MKTISLELSKRLAHYLKNIETEYSYDKMFEEHGYTLSSYGLYSKENLIDKVKTLNLEEAIDFLPEKLDKDFILTINRMWRKEVGTLSSEINKKPIKILNYVITYIKDLNEMYEVVEDYGEELFKHPLLKDGKTLLEVIEKMLECLIDNNLLGQKQENN